MRYTPIFVEELVVLKKDIKTVLSATPGNLNKAIVDIRLSFFPSKEGLNQRVPISIPIKCWDADGLRLIPIDRVKSRPYW